jgi:hypothetical protein
MAIANVGQGQSEKSNLYATLGTANIHAVPRTKTESELRREAELRAIGRRIEIAAKSRGIPVTHLDEATGQSRGQTTRLVQGERKRGVNPTTLDLYAKALRVPHKWLLLGEGDMDAPPDSEPSALATLLRRSTQRDNIDTAVEYHAGEFTTTTVLTVRERAKAEGPGHAPGRSDRPVARADDAPRSGRAQARGEPDHARPLREGAARAAQMAVARRG